MPYAFCEAFQDYFDGFSGIKRRLAGMLSAERGRFGDALAGKTFKNPEYWQKSACPTKLRG